VEEIADVLDDFRPPDFMPVDLAARLASPWRSIRHGRSFGGAGQTGTYPVSSCV